MKSSSSFDHEALELYAEMTAEKRGVDFSEGETYDFTRCVRPDGSSYGTGGRCRAGSEQAKSPESESMKRTRNEMAGNRAAHLGGKADKLAKGPHHEQLRELTQRAKDQSADLRSRKQEMARLERAYKEQERKTKAEPTKENKDRLKLVIQAANSQERAVRRSERELERVSREFHRLNKKNERAKMSPAQRAEAARLDRQIKEMG